MNTYFRRVASRTATDFWVNNVTLREAGLAIQAGCAGCTQNPAFVWKILNESEDKETADEILAGLLSEKPDDDNVLLAELQARLVQRICREFLPVYEQTGGKAGWVSIQGDPFREDPETIMRYGRYCRTLAPNVIVKIPATESGLAAIEALLPEGVPVLATEVMSMDQAAAVCDIYDRCAAKSQHLPTVYLAQIAGIFDEHLQDTAQRQGLDIDPELYFTAGIAVGKKVRKMMADRRSGVRFMSGGARALYHFTELVGVDGSVTMNWDGYINELIRQNPPVVQRFHSSPDAALIDELAGIFPDFRKAYIPGSLSPADFESFGPVVRFRQAFEKGWRSALGYIGKRRLSTERVDTSDSANDP